MRVAKLDSRESDGRSASFISYIVAVDQNMRYQYRAVDLQPRLCYGQLLNIITVDLPHHPSSPDTSGTTIALAHLRPANTLQHRLGLRQWD
ncbi:hypothetical protein CNBG_10043 [Cryptococcus deuterogattii R265]|uniref:uncharacterized protein n=1 Tax=Cryptococcus deuterogattii (strain R265) TaxID=294750 RepID=UPI001937F570|nr:hypothetical protein CNBG_10043 [Cryptococcus deuterogattii R265]